MYEATGKPVAFAFYHFEVEGLIFKGFLSLRKHS